MVSSKVLTLISILLVAVKAKNFALETNDVSDHFLTTTSINFLFDIFLKHYTSKLIEEGKTKIETPSFQRIFSKRILSVDVEGGISVTEGWCSNISTLHRTGDAEMDRVNEDVILSAHLGLTELKVDYDDYDISILKTHQRGKIHVSFGENSLWLKLRVQLKPSCDVSLTDWRIEKMDKIHVDITNLGIFENLTDEITSWVTNEVTTWYRHQLEQTVFPELAKAVKDADLCRYLPF